MPPRFDRYQALALVVRDRLMARWIKTQETYRIKRRQARLLPIGGVSPRTGAGQQPPQPGTYKTAEQVMHELGYHLGDLLIANATPGLATAASGAWRLVTSTAWRRSCPATATASATSSASSIRVIRGGAQIERPEEWLRMGNRGPSPAPSTPTTVRFFGHTETVPGPNGPQVRWVERRACSASLRHADRRLP